MDVGSEDMWVKVRGLPLNVSAKTILKFFYGVSIKHGLEGIHLSQSCKGQSNREAYVQVETKTDMVMAKEKHRQRMGRRVVDVVDATRTEIESVVKKNKAAELSEGDDGGCERVPSLTFNSSHGSENVEDRLGNSGDSVCSCGLSERDKTERDYKTKKICVWEYSDVVGFLLNARTRLNISLRLLDFNFATLDGATGQQLSREGVGVFKRFSARHGEKLYRLFCDHDPPDSATAKAEETTVNKNGSSSKENGEGNRTVDDEEEVEEDRVGDNGRDSPMEMMIDEVAATLSPISRSAKLQFSADTSKKGNLASGVGKKRGLRSERESSESSDNSTRQRSPSPVTDSPTAKKHKLQQSSEDLVLLGMDDDDSLDSFDSKQHNLDKSEDGDILILGTEEGDLDKESEDPPPDNLKSQLSKDRTKTATEKESGDEKEGEESKVTSLVLDELSDEEDELLLKPESPPINLSEMCEPFSDSDEDDELLNGPEAPTPPAGTESSKEIKESENGNTKTGNIVSLKKDEGESNYKKMVEVEKDDDDHSDDFDVMGGSLIVMDEVYSDEDFDDDESIKSLPIKKEPPPCINLDKTSEMDILEALSDDEEDFNDSPDVPTRILADEVGDDLDLDQMLNNPVANQTP